MNTRTATLTLTAPRDEVFAFLANLENLPFWAVETCRELRREGVHWKMHGLSGQYYITNVGCRATGVIDLLFGTQPDEMEVLPIRVIRRPHGCAVVCTLFQAADQSDDVFAWRYAALLIELRALAAWWGGGCLQAPIDDAPMLYPGIVTGKFHETWDFYTTQLGCRTLRESDGFVQLQHLSGAQLALRRHEQSDQPSALVSAVEGRGFWLGLNVADVDSEYARLVAAEVPVVSAPEDKPGDERSFVISDPNGVLIVISQPTASREVAEMDLVAAASR